MKIIKNLEHGIIYPTGEKTYKYILTLDHWASKRRRMMNSFGNNWQFKTIEHAIESYNQEINLIKSSNG